ncbi:LOW QUALITY PROTEIN: hypothetical protein PanWU01x14_039660 [Parasponia andersonii]|uniref:Uncharacterized protein n=1 Tax=Parasponia andersonii TaxID=3476 RepID=A0A2P5DQZ3_PARAD|nr:LOW QUALITY PROTEIN: hypothetical protein PanWU01x14_039660 [Parasponia andersonii]
MVAATIACFGNGFNGSKPLGPKPTPRSSLPSSSARSTSCLVPFIFTSVLMTHIAHQSLNSGLLLRLPYTPISPPRNCVGVRFRFRVKALVPLSLPRGFRNLPWRRRIRPHQWRCRIG